MRLLELSIQPKENLGWGSKTHTFGKDVTQLYGPNGCGKTPMIHSIAYAMGYPVRYREDILAHCESVTLKAIHIENEIIFKRKMGSEFHLECIFSGNNETKIFYNEKDVSTFLLDILGVSTEALTSNKNDPASPYISTFLPLFYVDQDSGYTNIYYSPANFIKDQYSEMVRLALNTPAKHSYEGKKYLIEKKKSLEQIDLAIVNKEKFIENLLQQTDKNSSNSDEVEMKINHLKDKLDELRTSLDAASDANSVVNYMVNEKLTEKREVDYKARDLGNRIADFDKIKNEIEIEINTLSLNEESRRLFTSFNDICASTSCQLFLTSSESYGKNLLYLKDQIKDLERNTNFQQGRLSELKQLSENLSQEIEKLRSDVNNTQSGTAQSFVNTISEITKSIIDLQESKEVLDRIQEENNATVFLLNQRDSLQNDIASIEGGSSSSDLRIIEFRTEFKNNLVDWLEVLSTKNVSRDITVDSNFNVQFGAEKITQFSGSTLLRVVLSMKAAFFEVYISRGLDAIEFLVFDTPRQHDIESEHFAAFISRLKTLVKGNSAQIIFSTTEYHYDSQVDDIEWSPSFAGFEQNMFLGTIEQLSAG